MVKKNVNFETLHKLSREIKVLHGTCELLGWDQETYMPEAAFPARAEQRSLILRLAHEKLIDPQYEEAVRNFIPSTPDEEKCAQIWLKDITKAKKLPAQFVEKFAQVTSEAEGIWHQAKLDSNWSRFLPTFETIVSLVRQKAEYLGYTDNPYDPLLDQYEPDTTTRDVTAIFSKIRPEVVELVRIASHPRASRRLDIGTTTIDQELQMARSIVSLIDYPWNKSRLDLSSHPFSTAYHPTDSRITIRKNATDALDQIMSALHEAGHSLYEMGLPVEHYGTPICEAASLGVHESQSRFWEVMIGRSHAFSEHISQVIRDASALTISPHTIYGALNTVSPSLIRTESDEVTYPLHVILRFEIEQELVRGTLQPKDVPARWNEGMFQMLGVVPKNNREGCLQDIHWSMGAFGYFPTYLLGTVYAAELFTKLEESIPDIFTQIKNKNFQPIHTWLHDTIWKYGRIHGSKELIEKAIGRPLNVKNYTDYLKRKFTPPAL